MPVVFCLYSPPRGGVILAQVSKNEIFKQLNKELKVKASAEYAERNKGVINSNHQLLGVKVPDLRQIALDFKNNYKGAVDFDDVCRLASRLWRGRYHDQRKLALTILEKYTRYFDEQSWEMLDEWIDDADAWDLIDQLSVSLLGKILLNDMGRLEEVRQWTKSDNFWRRRASCAACVALVHGKHNYAEEALSVGGLLIKDNHEMVRKAVVWLLREVSRKAPDDVYSLLLKNKDDAPRFLLREASKKLSDLQKMELLVR
ncbi:MAG: hypothetical protein GF307_01400 [candidate division Zixibacteria bacterium]|nr:hypothetical protein [candidate division Zixibacteria bacterium]